MSYSMSKYDLKFNLSDHPDVNLEFVHTGTYFRLYVKRAGSTNFSQLGGNHTGTWTIGDIGAYIKNFVRPGINTIECRIENSSNDKYILIVHCKDIPTATLTYPSNGAWVSCLDYFTVSDVTSSLGLGANECDCQVQFAADSSFSMIEAEFSDYNFRFTPQQGDINEGEFFWRARIKRLVAASGWEYGPWSTERFVEIWGF